MIRVTLIFALLACSITTAFAGSTAASSAGTSAAGSSASSASSSGNDKNDKVVLQARDDAASFVATDGRIRGAQLEAAFRYLRERNAGALRASDMQLAQAILAL